MRLGTLEAVRALERHAADVDRRLVRLGDVRRPRGEVVLNAVQVIRQLLRALLHAEQLAQQAEGLEGVVVQRGVRSRHDDHRDPRAALQVVRPVDVGAHDDDLRAGAQDRLRVGLPAHADHRQRRKLLEVDVVVQPLHRRLGLILLHADHAVLRAHIADIAQRADAGADDALHFGRNFDLAAEAVDKYARRRPLRPSTGSRTAPGRLPAPQSISMV